MGRGPQGGLGVLVRPPSRAGLRYTVRIHSRDRQGSSHSLKQGRDTGWGFAGDRQAPWWHGGTRGSSGESDKMGDKRESGENGGQGKVCGIGLVGRGMQGRAGGHG